jgi:hypothetical protein
MPKFPENTGFKLPGIGSKEKDTPGNFREDQRVEDVGYCDNTEAHMLPQGSSPLLATDDPKDWLVPDYYSTTYTGSAWPKGKDKPSPDKDKDKDKVTSQLEVPEYEPELGDVPEVPDLVSKSKGGKEQGQILTNTTTRDKGWTDLKNEFISQGLEGDELTKKMNEAKLWREKNPNVKNVGITKTNKTYILPDGTQGTKEEYEEWLKNK